MPSSPDAAVAWEPGELRSSAAATQPASPAAGLAFFEVASGAAVPDELLASARATARAQGWSTGWAEGMRAAAARAEGELARQRAEHAALIAEQHAEVQRAVAALRDAAAELERRALPTVDEMETLLLRSAFAVAETLVGHALLDDETRAPAALARALALAPVGEPVTVRLSPTDHARLIAAGAADPERGRSVTLIADAALEPGDAVATTGATEIDARIRTGIARVREVLAP
jgi:flagellar assembly protein FliH